jgi:hypothetical protein
MERKKTTDNSNLSFVCCNWKTETANFQLFSAKGKQKIVFPWSINDKWKLTFAVSENMPICDK